MSDVAARHDRFQLSLAALVVLITLLATAIVLAFTDSHFWPTCAMYFYFPFAVGLVVGRRSKSRAQLLTAPPVAAAIVPPLLLIPLILVVSGPIHRHGFLEAWIMLFPILLVLGAPAALLGSVTAYWFRNPRLAGKVRD